MRTLLPPTPVDILKAMLPLLATGHAKKAYARAKEGKKQSRGGIGHKVNYAGSSAHHFSIIGAHLKACDALCEPLGISEALKIESASRKLLDQAAIELRFIRNTPKNVMEANLEVWNDLAEQREVLAVVNLAIQLGAGERSEPQQRALRQSRG